MAFDPNGTRFLLYARRLGVDFSRTAMIGRQRLQLTERELHDNLRIFDPRSDRALAASLLHGEGGYSEAFLRYLGAAEVHSFDGAAYEGATQVHDMNLPIASGHKEQYSLVLDGGSLEHVFNFPVAIRNCMEMVAAGGHFLTMGPGNNFMGHGFYQFSPELFFRLLNADNGYRMVRLLACEQGPRAPWFTVRDPEVIRKRVGVVSRRRVTLLVLAQRVALRPVLQSMPQQSDYAMAWARAGSQAPRSPGTASWRRRLRRRVKGRLQRVLAYKYGAFDPRLFERFDLARELRTPLASRAGTPARVLQPK
jgi:hypothetical protein